VRFYNEARSISMIIVLESCVKSRERSTYRS